MKIVYSIVFVLCLSLALPNTVRAQAEKSSQSVSELYDLMNQYAADFGSLRRYYFIGSSPERRTRFTAFYKQYLKKLEQFNFNQLSVNGQVDYLLTKAKIDSDLYRLAIEESDAKQIESWVNFGTYIYTLEKERRRGKQLDWKQVANQLNEISTSLAKISIQLETEAPVFTRNVISNAQGTLQGYEQALKSVYDFYNGYDPDFSWWVEKPYLALKSQLKDYSKLLEKRIDAATLPPDDGSGIIGNPIGEKELRRLLKNEFIYYSPEELVEIAMKEFAWCDKELLKASQEMGFGNDWKAAQEKVKESYVPQGEQPQAMLKLYDESVAFLKKHDLLTIPPMAEETWRMTMIPPERQLISPFFLGGEVLQISYPTDAMEHQDKLMSMRGNNPHFSRATVHHELIAGHHLQRFMNSRYKPYRNFNTPFWTEGWALYWELTLWDMDFPQSPEDRIGMLFWRMHRCARIIFSLNYHLGKWTPQQCIDYLVDRVGHERANAEGEVRRSFTAGYGPLYQLAYMTGGLQFLSLRNELVNSKKMTLKEFHDAVLRENSMPVELLRAILLNQPLKKNYKTSWKFYER